MKLTTADLVVLSVLAYERPMHGYELMKTLQQRHLQNWARVSKPQVYYSIRKLAKAELLEAVGECGPSLGPEKITYKVSDRAFPLIANRLAEKSWTQDRSPSPFTTWSALALFASPDAVRIQISERALFLKNEIENSEQTLAELRKSERGDVKLAIVLIQMSIQSFLAELSMLSELEEVLLANLVQHD
jgi:DNA-binding PadR family transcriptional regulator